MISGLLHLVLESLGPTMLLQILFRSFSQLSNILVCVCVCVCVRVCISHFCSWWYEESTHWKDPHAGKDWWQEEKGVTEDETVGWHHRLNGHKFEQAPGDGEGQGSLACCSPWSCKESDMTDWTEQKKNRLTDIEKDLWLPRGRGRDGKMASLGLADANC